MGKATQLDTICHDLINKCVECGVDPASFITEKALELEERKKILATPSKTWFNENLNCYPDFVAKALNRELSDEERYGDEGLLAIIKRRLNPLPRELENEASLKRLLLRESNGRCKICGTPLTINTVTIDHILPLAEGGSNHTLNLQATCNLCNNGKSDYFQQTAQASARPWWEPRKNLLDGTVRITPTKRFCVLMRDGSTCRNCGITAETDQLKVVMRVGFQKGGQAVYDNLLTLCSRCARQHSGS